MATESYYVYQYLTEEGTPYYIGKGKGNRMHVDHKHIALPPRERRVIVKDNLSNADAKQIEKDLITHFGRKVDGGILDNIKINQWACAAGWKHSDEAKQKISDGNLGKVRSAEAKEKYRQPKSAEHAEKIRQANLGLRKSAETKQKISESKQGTTPWNKGIKGIPWSEARRLAHINKVPKEKQNANI